MKQLHAQKNQANFSISSGVLRSLQEQVPSRKRSQFVEEAIEKALKKDRLLQAIDMIAGSWKSKDHKEPTEKFIRQLRESKRI